MDHPKAASDNGKMWAAISYGSFFIGFPLGVIPILQRDDPYALYHAKHATAVWLVMFVVGTITSMLVGVVSIFTFGLGALCMLPLFGLLAAWWMVVAIHGLVLSLNGEWQEPIGAFGLGDLMFGSVVVKEPQQLPEPPAAPGA